MKDNSHPIRLFRNQLCFIGGDWVGEDAKNDLNTLATFERELGEELSFNRPVRDSVVLHLLGMSAVERFSPTPQPMAEVTPADVKMLNRLKQAIIESATPFGDFLNTVERAALDAADPANKLDKFTALSSYWAVALQEDAWGDLFQLQGRFKNLSSESLTLITSLEKIIEADMKTTAAHDRVLQRFFLQQGLTRAKNLPLVPNVHSVEAGMPLSTYQDYLDRFEVANKPV